MSKQHSIFHGAFTAIVTPFSSDGKAVDFTRLADQLHCQSEGGGTGVVPCGTTGESPTLTEEEHHSVVESTIETAKPYDPAELRREITRLRQQLSDVNPKV